MEYLLEVASLAMVTPIILLLISAVFVWPVERL